MTRPRIVHVYKDVYPPVEGGIERTIYHMARLTKDEFEPVVITASRSFALRSRSRFIDGDIPVIEVPSLGRLLSTPLAPGFVSALGKSRADLFHFHFPHPTGEVAWLLSGLKTPAVVTYHSDVVRQKSVLRFYNPLLHRFLSRMKVIMPTSQRYLESSATLAPHREHCRVVPLGLPLENYEPTDETRARTAESKNQYGGFVFFIGVLRYYKGLNYLIDAMRELPGVKAVIAGDGPQKELLVSLASQAGVADRIHFLGSVDHATAVALFHAASVFCLPACERSEAYGLCQIEALACGLPIVSTDLPTGVPEINRDGITGLIVPPKDSKALAAAIKTLLDNPKLRQDMSLAARTRALRHYTADAMARQIKEVYATVLAS